MLLVTVDRRLVSLQWHVQILLIEKCTVDINVYDKNWTYLLNSIAPEHKQYRLNVTENHLKLLQWKCNNMPCYLFLMAISWNLSTFMFPTSACPHQSLPLYLPLLPSHHPCLVRFSQHLPKHNFPTDFHIVAFQQSFFARHVSASTAYNPSTASWIKWWICSGWTSIMSRIVPTQQLQHPRECPTGNSMFDFIFAELSNQGVLLMVGHDWHQTLPSIGFSVWLFFPFLSMFLPSFDNACVILWTLPPWQTRGK